jgi:hypothetical protein
LLRSVLPCHTSTPLAWPHQCTLGTAMAHYCTAPYPSCMVSACSSLLNLLLNSLLQPATGHLKSFIMTLQTEWHSNFNSAQPYWRRPADTAPEMPPKAPKRTRPPAPHLFHISGAERSEPNRRRKSVTFRRRPRPVDVSAPETTCMFGLIIFPVPSWGLSGAGDYLCVRTDRLFSGAVLGTFRRRRLPVCVD